MFTKLGVILIAVIVLIGLTVSGLYGIFGGGRNGGNRVPDNPSPAQDSGNKFQSGLDVAQSWIAQNSPTYLFDGSNLKYIEGAELNCFECFGYMFSFDSSHAGYGNREGSVLAQVVTPHTVAVTVKEGVVIQAITDEVYDEIRQEFIPGIKNSGGEAPQPE